MNGYILFKRMMDFFLSILLLVMLSPIMLIVVCLIKLLDNGPVLFKQQRPGKNAKIFTVYKFRTMTTVIEKNGKPLTDIERMTKVGRFLRKTSIDELPQLFNILKGEMSFIGPRPLLVRYLPYYSQEQMRRHEVTPGISGWAQVNGRNAISWTKRFELDVWYVDHISLKLDIKIFFMTIQKVLKTEGVNHSNKDTMTFFDEEVKESRDES
jgi:lipopolysaccharide/colanic/teichoic acid biosynthesis glycosyltransferase